MKLVYSVIFFVLTLQCKAQHFPFDVSFTRMYLGEYDPTGKQSTKLRLSPDVRYIDASYDGNQILNCIFVGTQRDTLSLTLTFQSQTPGDDFVEYKYLSNENYLVFFRYRRYGVPGILELSIFKPERTQFFYIKQQQGNVKN